MIFMRFTASAAAALLAFSFGAQAADEHREHGAHQHGHGNLELAIEKTVVSIKLKIPGDDIVGFEHPPADNKQKAAIETAKKTLADALTLFGIPKDAACKVEETNVHTHGYKAGEDHDDHKHEAPKTDPKDTKDVKGDEKQDHKHGSFHAKYKLDCAKPSAITALSVKLFATFPRSQALDIVAVSEKGQVKAEATRKKPNVALRGLW